MICSTLQNNTIYYISSQNAPGNWRQTLLQNTHITTVAFVHTVDKNNLLSIQWYCKIQIWD